MISSQLREEPAGRTRNSKLKKNEAESTDAYQEIVLIVFLRKYPRFGIDGLD